MTMQEVEEPEWLKPLIEQACSAVEAATDLGVVVLLDSSDPPGAHPEWESWWVEIRPVSDADVTVDVAEFLKCGLLKPSQDSNNLGVEVESANKCVCANGSYEGREVVVTWFLFMEEYAANDTRERQ